MTRYIAGFLLAVGLIVVVIILIVRGLTGGPSAPAPSATDLTSYANTDTKVQMVIDSPVSATDTHRDIVVTVGNDQTTAVVIKGYSGEVLRQESYPMNADAYAAFLHALAKNGYTKGNDDESLRDERGQCALGDRYVFAVVDGSGSELQHYWYTSCGSGTFRGDANAVRTLFRRQVPDFDKLTSDIQF